MHINPMNDPDIHRIALQAVRVSHLLPSETPLPPTQRLIGTHWYIGKRGAWIVLFANNLHNHEAERVRLLGRLDAIHRCDAIERRLPLA